MFGIEIKRLFYILTGFLLLLSGSVFAAPPQCKSIGNGGTISCKAGRSNPAVYILQRDYLNCHKVEAEQGKYQVVCDKKSPTDFSLMVCSGPPETDGRWVFSPKFVEGATLKKGTTATCYYQ